MLVKNSLTLEAISIFCISLILFTWGLSSQEVISFDSRFYLFALEMWRHGASWFSTTYQQPYPDYPATSTWLIYLFAKSAGTINKLIAVLPSAMMASVTLVMTYLVGVLHNKHWGRNAVFLLLLTFTFFKSARSIALDLYPTMITVCCFYLVYSADKIARTNRTLWVYPLLLLSFLFRGPIGLVMPTGVICTYYLLDQNYKRFFQLGLLSTLLLIVCTGLLLLLAQHVGGNHFMRDVLRMEILGRMTHSHLPIYYYLTNSIGSYALSFPLALAVIFGTIYYGYHKHYPLPHIAFIWKLTGWMAIIMVGMSIPGDKKVRYILPMAPAAALIAAYPFSILLKENYFIVLRRIIIGLLELLPCLIMLTTVGIFYYAKNHQWHVAIAYPLLIILLLTLQLITAILFHRHRKQTTTYATKILALAAISFALSYIMLIEPIELHIDRAREFVIAIENQRLAQQAELVFYKEQPDGLPIKYLINMPKEEQPLFINNPQAIIDSHKPAYYVTSVSYFRQLPNNFTKKLNIVGYDYLGHKPVVVFTKKQ